MKKKINRPMCLIGSLSNAEQWIESNVDETKEVHILKDDILMEDIKNFEKFLIETSLNKKVGIIYFFNKLNDSKQSVFLKIFENLPEFSNVIIHILSFVNFTIHTRCEIHYLKNQKNKSEDIKWLFDFFQEEMKKKTLTKQKMNGINTYLETLNLRANGYLSEEEKKNILKDLK